MFKPGPFVNKCNDLWIIFDVLQVQFCVSSLRERSDLLITHDESATWGYMAIYSTITLPVQKYNLCNTVGVSCSFCRLLPRTVWLCRTLKLVRRWIRIFSGHTDAEKEMSHGGKVIFSTLPCSEHTVIPSQSTVFFFSSLSMQPSDLVWSVWPRLLTCSLSFSVNDNKAVIYYTTAKKSLLIDLFPLKVCVW